MMMSNELLMIGDKVYYVGQKYGDRLHGKPGWLHAPVVNEPGVWIVEFPDTRNAKDPEDTDDYIMSVNVLTRQRPHGAERKEEKKEGPEIQPRRRRRTADEE
jgi:hypothetical protein